MDDVPKSQEKYLKLILLQLKESLRIIESVIASWKKLCCSGRASARRVVDLSEQLEVCHTANLNLIPSKLPPNIKENLQCKIQEALEEELIELNETLKGLKENQEVVKLQSYQAEKVYRENSKHLDICVQNLGNASRPSILEIVEYIDVLQSFFVKDFLMRKFSLENLKFQDKKSAHDLKECWEELNMQKSGMTDFEPVVQHFLQES